MCIHIYTEIGGTHNALLSLGEDTYLEIISPDPSQTNITSTRVFHLDEVDTHKQIIAYAVRSTKGNGITELQEILGAGPVGDKSRKKPDGTLLEWRMTPATEARGARPWIIDWGDNIRPAESAPKGCELVSLAHTGPSVEQMGDILTGKMGLLTASTFVNDESMKQPKIIATIRTPKGIVKI